MREARISIINTVGRTHETNEAILGRTRDRIRSVSRDKPDLILMAELFANHPPEKTRPAYSAMAQTVPGPISEELSSFARKYRTYIAFGLLRRVGRRVFNSLVLLNREGRCVWIFDKVTPTDNEITGGGVTPGRSPRAFQTDFGRIGAAICFDINFLELAEIYARQETELILFSSAFPAGRLLDFWAVRWGFHVAGCTWYADNRVLDCCGATVAHTSDFLPTATAVLNLNRRMVHMDYNMDKISRMLDRYAGDVIVEDMRPEAVCVITVLKKGLKVTDLIREFRIETLPHYFARARQVRARHGGLPVP